MKTKAILFRSKNKPISINYTLSLGTSSIEIVSQHKTLGVFFSENMTWDCHINYLIAKLSRVVGIVSRCRNVLPLNIKLKIYYALFQSHLSYCHLVWATTTKTNLKSILLLQKKIIRYIADVSYTDHTEPLFLKYRIIPVERMYEYRLLCSTRFSYTLFIDLLFTISELVRYSSDVNIRRREAWVLPHSRTNYNLQTLHYNVPLVLNKCITNNINIYTISKRDLRSYIFIVP